MGFRSLRVINDDRVSPGQGFGTHPHRDMEIISYVVEGALEHRDSMGTGSVIRPGDVQRMSAGTGVTHSEYNASKSEPVHFLQIWIVPDVRGLAPSYEQRHFAERERRGTMRVVASPDGRDGSVSIHNDVVVYAGGVVEAGAGDLAVLGDVAIFDGVMVDAGAFVEGRAGDVWRSRGQDDRGRCLLFGRGAAIGRGVTGRRRSCIGLAGPRRRG